MNLVGLTEGQRQSVEQVRGPLLVSAGAGSGKTFTLTQRIAYALQPEVGILGGVDEVLAITFTEKAAAEIKARVKSTLRQEGLTEQALKVDAAWISTIHGMCSRILRTHALEIGIDPGFGIIDDSVRRDMIAESINEVLGQDNEIISRRHFEALFDEFPARSAFPTQASVASMLETLINKAANLRGGFDDFLFGPEPAEPKELARDLLLAYEQVIPALEQGGSSKTAVEVLADAGRVMELLEALLVSPPNSSVVAASPLHEDEGRSSADSIHPDGVELSRVAEIVDSCEFIPRKFGSEEVKEAIGVWQQEYIRISHELVAVLAKPVFEELMLLAREVSRRYETKKQEAFVLDNDDLLLKTLKAFDHYPDLVKHYQQQFKLVMVDEFQDTSQVQIDIIEKLIGKESNKLCTVGDSQQSIYRFRGADVNVYEFHKRKMRSKKIGALSVELTKNFRSHADILSFVDRVFGQSQVFGDKFMSLEPDSKRTTHYLAQSPRVDLVLAMRPAGNNTGVSLEDAKWMEAKAIATRFAAFRDAGHDAGEMVLLLGKMTNAHLFAHALREKDFECVIAGGSLFDRAPEVHIIARFAEVLANPANSAALFEVLSSDMFRLGADDFLRLSTVFDETTGEPKRCDLQYGFDKLRETARAAGETDEASNKTAEAAGEGVETMYAAKTDEAQKLGTKDIPDLLLHAVRVLDKAWSFVGHVPVARIIEEAVLDSGWMTRLEGQGAFGTAQAANILKAIRHIESLEGEGARGVAQLAQEFSAQLSSGLKEAPGALSGSETGVVKIMTIHASKGLEFPLVALADFYGVRSSSDKLLLELCEGRAYASLMLGEGLGKYPSLAKRLSSFDPFADGDPIGGFDQVFKTAGGQALYRAALKGFAQSEELAEVRRKFYVGLTRASEALIISASVRNSSRDPLLAYKDVVDDVRAALCGDDDFPLESATLEYGGSAPAAFERIAVAAGCYLQEDERSADSLGDNSSSGEGTFFIPRFEEGADAHAFVYRPMREGVFSYSSLSPREAEETKEQEKFIRPEKPADAEKATALGSAFHLLAQYAIETDTLPDGDKIEGVANYHALSDAQKERLNDSLARWFGSDLFARVKEYPLQRAELPFFIAIDGVCLEGEIDAFCTEGLGHSVLIIDYKTGGTSAESAADLYEKHLLQATCYAYATLIQGYPEVELQFVRVEQEVADSRNNEKIGQPQTVSYEFSKKDLPELKHTILEAYKASH